MSSIRTEKEIKSLTKEQNYCLGYSDSTKDMLDKVKQAREDIDDLERYFDNDSCSNNTDSMFKCKDILDILDKLIAESEENNG